MPYYADMRNITIAPGEYYHVYNRGYGKQAIFLDDNDYSRFLFLILYFQSPKPIQQINRIAKTFLEPTHVQHSVLDILIQSVVDNRLIELVAFCLMPNHFHLLVKEVLEGGTARYMQKVLNAYTKYFNTKYERSGHLFQGPYKAVHISSNEQLLHTSAYLHRNPRELPTMRGKEHTYLWSSYQDCVGKNRFPKLLETTALLEQFKSKEEYFNFVETSPAKLFEDQLDELNDR